MIILMEMYNFNNELQGLEADHNEASLTHHNTMKTTTPKIPEIIQSLMSITGPLENDMKQQTEVSRLTPDNFFSEYTSCDTCSSTSSITASPIDVQNLKSQFIKEGLKLTLQRKRSNLSTRGNETTSPNRMGSKYEESSMDTEEDDSSSSHGCSSSSNCVLTLEDEERRRRRRDRNKIAATKCRVKKRLHAKNLEDESKELKCQNLELKSKIQELENQHLELEGMLNMHKLNCVNPSPETSPIFDPQQPPCFLPIYNNYDCNEPCFMNSAESKNNQFV